MGILNIFKQKNTETLEPLTVYAPVSGKAVPLNEVPDEIFGAGILGSGCGIWPEGNKVKAPFHGVICQVADTKHAVGVKSSDGMELLIHVGLDTVDMAGNGFQVKVREGQKVLMGETLLEFDMDAVQKAGHPEIVIVVVTNSPDFKEIRLLEQGQVTERSPLLKLTAE